MKKIRFLCFLTFACNKDEAAFTSVEGTWTFSTPDNKIVVTFDFVKVVSGAFEIQNLTFKLDGVLVNAEQQVDGLNPPAITRIRFNVNDSNAIYPYDIIFNNAAISADFKTIEVPDASYTWPWGTKNDLSDITIVRQ